MVPSVFRRFSSALLLAGFVGCGGDDVLTGRWQSEPSRQDPQTFTFERGGRARWEIGPQSGTVFELRYRLSTKTVPWSLDLTGFETGPMVGSKMLCVAEMASPDELALDCWPAELNKKNAARPKKLGPSAVRLKRVAP